MDEYTFWNKTESNPVLTKEQVFNIGEIVVIWGEIEAQTQILIWKYLEVHHQTGMLVTAPLSLEAKKNLLRDLADKHELDKDRLYAIREALAQLDSLKAIRNQIVHGLWLLAVPVTFKKLAKQTSENPYVPLEIDLEGFANQSGALATKLLHITRNMYFPNKYSVDLSP